MKYLANCQRASHGPWVRAVCSVTMMVLLHSRAFSADNEIFRSLTEKGIEVEQAVLKLPAPTMADGLDAAAQQKLLGQVADENHPLDALLRKSPVSPFVLKIAGDDPSEKAGTLRKVDLWFVAYGDLKKLSDETFLKSQINDEAKDAPESERGKLLTADDLKQRDIEKTDDRRYLASHFTMFDRARLSGVMQAQLTRADQSIILAATIDPRFAKDRDFPNQWQSIVRDDDGRSKVGPPQPYASAGFYIKATQLQQPSGAIFVEYHLVFDEPAGWFNGANLLRSKLPLVAQDAVRKFRRRLTETVK